MANENNSQTNTFTEGMNSDTSDMLLSNSQYRHAQNLRYVTDVDSNTGELHMIEGSKQWASLDPKKYEILETTQLRNLGVLVVRNINKDGSTAGWSVWTCDVSTDEHDLKCVFSTEDTTRVVANAVRRLSLVTVYENVHNQKLYIADGVGPILFVHLNNLLVDGGSGSQDISGDISEVEAYPSVTFTKPIFTGIGVGSLGPGLYQYCYQLYDKKGAQSEMSPITKKIPLYVETPQSGQYSNGTTGFNVEQEDATGNKSISVKIIIPSPCPFDFIRIYRIHYTHNGQNGTVECIYDSEIEGATEIDYTDQGGVVLSTLTNEEFNMLTGTHIIPKVIESKNDYMFAANVVDLGNVVEDPELLNYKADTKAYKKDGTTYLSENNESAWDLQHRYTVEDAYVYNYDKTTLGGGGGDDDNISWKFIVTKLLGDVNDNDSCIKPNRSSGFDYSNVEGFYVTDEGFSTTAQTFDLSDELRISDTNDSYGNPGVSYSLKTLRRDEIYRFGIILYDENGGHTNVKWIADIRTPSTEYCKTFDVDSNGVLWVYSLGIQFDVKNLPEHCAAYEIVRCSRRDSDVVTVSQGVLSRPIQKVTNFNGDDLDDSKTPFTPTGWLMLTDYATVPDYKHYGSDKAFQYKTATNFSIKILKAQIDDSNDPYKTYDGNLNTFQFVSAETTYVGDSVNIAENYTLQPLQYIYPYVNNATSYPGHVSFGNQYTHLPLGFNRSTDNPYYVSESGNNPVIIYNRYGDGTRSDVIDAYYNGEKPTKSLENDKDRYQYVKLYETSNDEQLDEYKIDSGSTRFTTEESVDPVSSDTTTSIFGTTYPGSFLLGPRGNFINCICGGYCQDSAWSEPDWAIRGGEEHFPQYMFDDDEIGHRCGFMIGIGGPCMVITTKQDASSIIDICNNKRGAAKFGTFLCNIRNSSALPYGGQLKAAIKTSTYTSFGDYYVKQSADETKVVFDGDAYVRPLEYVSQHKWEYPAENPNNRDRKSCIVYSIPVETNINLSYTAGYEFSRDALNDISSNIQQKPVQYANENIQQIKPMYVYDDSYSNVNSPYAFISELVDDTDDPDYRSAKDYRIYWSNQKTNDEATDNWLLYKSNDHIDVDSRYGAITHMKKFNNQLIFWQEEAVGVIGVNERQLMSGKIDDDQVGTSNLPLILGTGDGVTRYDYIATSNGMRKNEFCADCSDTVLYWWDHSKHELCSYSGGQAAVVLSKVKYVQNFLNRMYEANKLVDRPVLVFDKQYNELLAYVSDPVEEDMRNRGALVFNEQSQSFTGLYNIQPFSSMKFKDQLLLTYVDKTVDGTVTANYIRKWNDVEDANDTGALGLKGANDKLTPYLKTVVNHNPGYTKVFDNAEFAGRVYGGDDLSDLTLNFYTPLKQHGSIGGDKITNREYNFRYAIPRNEDSAYGDRLRGKTMQCELESDNNSHDFSLQYILTKFRISWS